MVVVQKNENNNFSILSKGEKVGEIMMMSENLISYVEVQEKHRGNGYGPKSLKYVIDYINKNINKPICISSPVDDSLEPVLYEYGFKKNMDDIWKLENVENTTR